MAVGRTVARHKAVFQLANASSRRARWSLVRAFSFGDLLVPERRCWHSQRHGFEPFVKILNDGGSRPRE